MRAFLKISASFFAFLLIFTDAFASTDSDIFESGSIYRDYVWTVEATDDDGFLRVGGNYDYQSDEKFSAIDFHKEGFIPLGHELDLDKAIKAKLIVEKLLSHEGTTGFAVQFNQSEKIAIPESPHIPEPQTEYPHLFSPHVNLPLSLINQGKQNAFKLTVNPEQAWNWPQHLIYGVTLRVYYSSDKQHSRGKLVLDKEKITNQTTLLVKTQGPVESVDFLGQYADVDFNGNGKRHKWQYAIHRGKLGNHIGKTQTPPFTVNWDTTWLPDQQSGISLKAVITAPNGVSYVTPSHDELLLEREHSVEMAWLLDVPDYWTTRSKAVDAEFELRGPVKNAQAAKMFWASWSACYSHGVVINGYLTHTGMDEPCYTYEQHQVNLDPTILMQGKNTLHTPLTPLYKEQMVHGMEVLYPGMMIKVKYD